MTIEPSTEARECTRTPGEKTERRTSAPEMTTPGLISELMAWPVRFGSSCTNFAGGSGGMCVMIGQARL